MLELRHIEGIGQAAHIKHKVGLLRQTVLETERHHSQRHRAFPFVQKQSADPLTVLRCREQRGIDHILCLVPQRLQQLALPGDCLGDGDLFADGDGVLTAGLFIAALDHGIICIQKQNIIVDLFLVQILKSLLELLNAAHTAHIHDDCHTAKLVFALQGEVHDTRQQRHRDVVNAEKADVLQCVDSHRLARTGKSRHDQKIHLPHRSLILPRGFRVPARSRSFP